jgi:hypothetical protein
MVGGMRVQDQENGQMVIQDCSIHAALPAFFGSSDQGQTGSYNFRMAHKADCATNPLCRWLALPADQ